MWTVGIDLAVRPENTALAAIEWLPGEAHVRQLDVGVDDDAILACAGTIDKIGIDCPLGWPDKFVAFLRSFHTGSHAAIPRGADSAWRKSLAQRLTDARVQETVGLNPLSVSTDRIGLTAMRAARIQALLAETGYPVDRVGDGLVVEVYPAAGLRHWQMTHRRYKGTKNEKALGELVDGLPTWLHFGDHADLCRRRDHAFDAVIAALLARAAALGHTEPPSASERAVAAREGWIALPTCPIDALVTP